MVGLMAFCITILGMIAIKEGTAQTILLIPLPIIVIIIWRYTEYKFKTLSQNMSLNLATNKDIATAVKSDKEYLNQEEVVAQADSCYPLVFPYSFADTPILTEKN
jgi:hypothetical protein